jgi:hypothetical protein
MTHFCLQPAFCALQRRFSNAVDVPPSATLLTLGNHHMAVRNRRAGCKCVVFVQHYLLDKFIVARPVLDGARTQGTDTWVKPFLRRFRSKMYEARKIQHVRKVSAPAVPSA